MTETCSAAAADEDNIGGRAGRRARSFMRGVHVEPLVFCYILSRTLMLLATQNLCLQKACRVNLRLSDETCAALADPTSGRRHGGGNGYPREHEVATQRLVADMLVWQLVVQSSVPCALAVFVGSWSDRNRRRVPCMLLPVASELVRVLGLLACVRYFDQMPLVAVGIVEAVPTSLAGGRMVFFNAMFSYVGDVTKEESKTLRIGIVNLLSTIGMAIGTALSGVSFKRLGFYGVYAVSAAVYLSGLAYGSVFIAEVTPKQRPAADVTAARPRNGCSSRRRGPFNGFFNVRHVTDAFHVTFKDGPHNRKLRIVMLMCIAFLITGPLNGDLSVSYLNTRVRFYWDEVTYSVFLTYSMVTNVAGTALSIGLFSHVLKIDDSLIGVMACTGKIFAGICYAFATNEWTYYLGPIIDVMGGTIFITARSIMTKIVGPDELGQVTAIYGIVESLVPIVFGPLYTTIYKNTVNILPGAYSLIGSTLAVPATIIYLWMYKESKKSQKYDCKVESRSCKEMQDVE